MQESNRARQGGDGGYADDAFDRPSQPLQQDYSGTNPNVEDAFDRPSQGGRDQGRSHVDDAFDDRGQRGGHGDVAGGRTNVDDAFDDRRPTGGRGGDGGSDGGSRTCWWKNAIRRAMLRALMAFSRRGRLAMRPASLTLRRIVLVLTGVAQCQIPQWLPEVRLPPTVHQSPEYYPE